MRSGQWALVLFTIMTQMAVGMVLWLPLLRPNLVAFNPEVVHLLLKMAFSTTLGLITISMLFSLLHLGKPLNAPLTIINFGKSWLSAEIVFSLLFTGTVGVLVVGSWASIEAEPFYQGLSLLGSLSGIALIHCMSRIYRIRTVPAWNSFITEISFFKTTLLLGLIGTSLTLLLGMDVLKLNFGDFGLRLNPVRVLFAGMILLLVGIDMFVLFFKLADARRKKTSQFKKFWQILAKHHRLFIGRQVVLLIGALLGSYGILASTILYPSFSAFPGLVFTTSLLLMGAEVIDRWFFYKSYSRFGE